MEPEHVCFWKLESPEIQGLIFRWTIIDLKGVSADILRHWGCGDFQYHFLALPAESTEDLLARFDTWQMSNERMRKVSTNEKDWNTPGRKTVLFGWFNLREWLFIQVRHYYLSTYRPPSILLSYFWWLFTGDGSFHVMLVLVIQGFYLHHWALRWFLASLSVLVEFDLFAALARASVAWWIIWM